MTMSEIRTSNPGWITKEWIILLLRVQSKHADFKPNAVVDVGANQGEWSAAVRKYFPETKLLLIEASEQHDQQLELIVARMENAEFRIALLTDTEGGTVNYFAGGNTGNSMFRENSNHYKHDTPVSLTTHTLDQVIQGSFLKNEIIDVIKVDVQGAELLVLRGGTRALSQATFVLFEVSLVEYNEGGSCFYDVDEYLRQHGFYLYDMAGFDSDPAYKTDGIGQYDVLYVKPTSPRLPKLLQEMNPMYCGQRRMPASSSGQVLCASVGLEQGQTFVIPHWFSVFIVGVLFGVTATRYLALLSKMYRKPTK